MQLKGKKVLVTGGAGFIGSHTANALFGRGAEAIVVDSCSTGKCENLNPAATFYDMNVADEGLEAVLTRERSAVIYHFACFVKVPESLRRPLLNMDVLRGTLRMLQCVAEVGVERIVFSSSAFSTAIPRTCQRQRTCQSLRSRPMSSASTQSRITWKVAEILQVEPKPIYHPDRPDEQIRYCVDISKARTHLGWSPQWSLEEGLPGAVVANRVHEPCSGSQPQ